MNYQSLSKDLEFLSEHLQNSEWAANALLNLSKPTQENLLKYTKSFKKIGRWKLFTQAFAFLPRMVARIVLCLLLSVLTPWEWMRKRNRENLQFDWLIVSNTSNLRSSNSVDSVMGHFAVIIKGEIAYLYLNAELTSTRARKKLSHFCLKKNVFICPKTESPVNTARQLVKNMVAVFEAIQIFVKVKETNRQQKYLLLSVAVAQFSRQTMTNSLIGKEVSRISGEINAKNLIYSYEGNAHELSILVKLGSKTIRKFPYQHAPIVGSQFGLTSEMRLFKDNISVLTSGLVTKKYFQKIQNDLNLHFPIIEAGSSKFTVNNFGSSGMTPSKSDCILFLPEADFDLFQESFEIMRMLAKSFKNLRFVIRKHPSMIIPRRALKNLMGDLPKNCSISSLSLFEDFQRSIICVFRSSAAAIEAASFGIYPVHIDFKNDFHLNPLDERFFKAKTLVAHSHEELVELLQSLLSDDFEEADELKTQMRIFAENYFSNPDNSEFREYLERIS